MSPDLAPSPPGPAPLPQPVWITGIGLVSSLGEGAAPHLAALGAAPAPVLDTTAFAPFPIHPLPPLNLDTQIPKKGDQRQMEPWQRLGTYTAGLALDDAAARPLAGEMHLVVAAGGGERDVALDEQVCNAIAGLPAAEAALKLNEMISGGLRPTLFLAQLSNLMAGNISIVHGVIGSSRTFMGEEQAGADAVRIAAQRIAEGRGNAALVGAAYIAGRWDMMLAYAGAAGGLWHAGWAPMAERQAAGGGMVMGSAGCFLVLETEAAARARGARGIARLSAITGTASRRRGEDTALAAAQRLAGPILPLLRPGHAVLSTASGMADAFAAERAFHGWMRDQGPAQAGVTTLADLIGHTVEAAFPTALALAALAVQAGRAPQALVSSFGMWRGEALALVEPIEEGVP